MIRYLYKNGESACSKEPLKVMLDGVITGEIRKVEGGFQYFSKGMKHGGRVFDSVDAVQHSLSDD